MAVLCLVLMFSMPGLNIGSGSVAHRDGTSGPTVRIWQRGGLNLGCLTLKSLSRRVLSLT